VQTGEANSRQLVLCLGRVFDSGEPTQVSWRQLMETGRRNSVTVRNESENSELRATGVKGKVHLYQTMKTQRGSRGILCPFFNLGARCGWAVNARLRPLYSQGNRHGAHCTGGWVDLEG
jgi:hypothetical protein